MHMEVMGRAPVSSCRIRRRDMQALFILNAHKKRRWLRGMDTLPTDMTKQCKPSAMKKRIATQLLAALKL